MKRIFCLAAAVLAALAFISCEKDPAGPETGGIGSGIEPGIQEGAQLTGVWNVLEIETTKFKKNGSQWEESESSTKDLGKEEHPWISFLENGAGVYYNKYLQEHLPEPPAMGSIRHEGAETKGLLVDPEFDVVPTVFFHYEWDGEKLTDKFKDNEIEVIALNDKNLLMVRTTYLGTDKLTRKVQKCLCEKAPADVQPKGSDFAGDWAMVTKNNYFFDAQEDSQDSGVFTNFEGDTYGIRTYSDGALQVFKDGYAEEGSRSECTNFKGMAIALSPGQWWLEATTRNTLTGEMQTTEFSCEPLCEDYLWIQQKCELRPGEIVITSWLAERHKLNEAYELMLTEGFEDWVTYNHTEQDQWKVENGSWTPIEGSFNTEMNENRIVYKFDKNGTGQEFLLRHRNSEYRMIQTNYFSYERDPFHLNLKMSDGTSKQMFIQRLIKEDAPQGILHMFNYETYNRKDDLISISRQWYDPQPEEAFESIPFLADKDVIKNNLERPLSWTYRNSGTNKKLSLSFKFDKGSNSAGIIESVENTTSAKIHFEIKDDKLKLTQGNNNVVIFTIVKFEKDTMTLKQNNATLLFKAVWK